MDTRFLDGAADFFPQAGEAQPEFQFKTPPRPVAHRS